MSEPKVKVISLDNLSQLFELLGVQDIRGEEAALEPLGNVNERLRRQTDFIDQYKKQVVKHGEEVMEEIIKASKINHCEHGSHRITPSFQEDHRAMYNFVAWLSNLQIDAARRVAVSAWFAGRDSINGEVDQPNYVADAMFGVLCVAVAVTTDILPNLSDVREFQVQFERDLRARMSASHEHILTGKEPVKRDKHAHCH